MSQESSKVISRQWKIIQYLLDSKYVSTADIEQHLQQQGMPTAQRTIQRDLNLLEELFPLECRRDSVPYSWRWKRIETTVKGLNITQALILRLVDEQLHDFLPEHTKLELAPLFQKAKLFSTNAMMASEDKSILDILTHQTGHQGVIQPSIFKQVFTGLSHKVNDIYRDTFHLDDKATHQSLKQLVIILESYQLPELAQALKA